MDSGGNFEYSLNLSGGDNHIVIVAVDPAGNRTEKQIKVILE